MVAKFKVNSLVGRFIESDRRNVAVYRNLRTGELIGIKSLAGSNVIHGLHEITVATYTKVPLYKQAMQLQMGRIPETKKQDLRTAPVQELDLEEYKKSAERVLVCEV